MALTLDFEQPVIELEEKLQSYLEYCENNGLDSSLAREAFEEKLPAVRDKIFRSLTAWNRVQLARHQQRPYPMDLAAHIFTDFLELHGDRRFSDDRAIVGGFAKLDGQPVMLIATCKGHNLKQNIEANFGSAHPEGYRKARRLMKLADKAGCPVICLVDTPGAYPGVAAEERHIGEAIAVSIRDMFKLRVPVISVITGEGGSGGALALAVANRLVVMENAYYSVITPEGCAAILWRTDSATARAAAALKLTSSELLKFNVADAVAPEPPGGAHRDWKKAGELLKQVICSQLRQLSSMSPERLAASRYEKFRALGQICEPESAAGVTIRKAREDEIPSLHKFFQPFVATNKILQRDEADIKRYLDNFILAVTGDDEIVGTVALRNFGDGLHEVRTLTVDPAHEGRGIGSFLIKAALEMAKKRRAKKVFTLTMRPGIFKRLGFSTVSIMRFPGKVQNDCLKCAKRDQCDEVAMLYEINSEDAE